MAFLGSLKKLFGSKDSDERTDLEKKIKSSPNDPQLRQKLALVLLNPSGNRVPVHSVRKRA